MELKLLVLFVIELFEVTVNNFGTKKCSCCNKTSLSLVCDVIIIMVLVHLVVDQLLSHGSSYDMKRAALELLQILPHLEQRHLQTLVHHVFTEPISASLTQYLVDIIILRCDTRCSKGSFTLPLRVRPRPRARG